MDESFICLASASPRRRELLTQLGVRFEVIVTDIDEAVRTDESPEAYVLRMASSKARAAVTTIDVSPAPRVLGADTTVVVGERILGKPADAVECGEMLRLLSGREHEVLTAVALIHGARESVVLSRTTVRFRPLQDAEIAAYWASGEPADKAGAYAIQGLGAVFIEEIRGSYSGVMGLPMFETAGLLNASGYRFM